MGAAVADITHRSSGMQGGVPNAKLVKLSVFNFDADRTLKRKAQKHGWLLTLKGIFQVADPRLLYQ